MRERIVIVDSEPVNAAALEDFLRANGYRHIVTLTGTELSAQRLQDETPDLVLIELSMQTPSALEVLGWMRTPGSLLHVPVVVVGGPEEREARLQALQNGANDVLLKPVDPAELRARLRNTLASKAYNDRLAYTDSITGLPNRESAEQRLDWALKHARRYDTVGAVLKVGFDRIHQVNDALGPTLSSALLRAVAKRLQTCVRETDVVSHAEETEGAEAGAVVARSDGDEFTVLLPLLEKPDDAAVVAQRILSSMTAPFSVGGYDIVVTCRVGIAVFPTDSTDQDTVLRQAALAMRQGHGGKAVAGNSIHFYSRDLNARSVHRLSLERELRVALEQNQLVLHYQPKVQVTSGRVSGAEALVRWHHPERGLMRPDDFITVAEESGLIGELGHWVMRTALSQLATWRQQGLGIGHVAVNVSSLQFQRGDLAETVCDALIDAGLPGAGLCLELTESAIMESGRNVMHTLQDIKRLGVRLALDDFGTGYSSLSYLHRFPLDELKIDRSFLAECTSGGPASAVIAAIIAMGHRLGLRLVAEGVENKDQLAFIRAEGCDTYQGYFFSAPLPADEFEALARRNHEEEDWAPTTGLGALYTQ